MELLPSGTVHAWLYGAKGTRFDHGAHTVSVPRNWTPDFRAEGIRGTGYLANLYVGAAEVAATYYDGLARPIQTKARAGGSDVVTQTKYNRAGKPERLLGPVYQTSSYPYSALTDAAAEVTHLYAYDHLGNVRVKKVSLDGLSADKTVRYVHDLAGRITRLVYPDGGQARYAYDGAGRLIRVWDAEGRTLAAYTHTAAGNIKTHVAGEGAGDGVATGTYAYNAREWVTDLNYADKFRSTLTYDRVGNVTRQVYRHGTATARTADYAYDDLHRITDFDPAGGVSQDFAYDRNGNVTRVVTGSSTLTYNYSSGSTPNRLDSTTGTGGETFGYNKNGWVTTRGANTLTYDYRGLTTGYGSATYLMDPDRRRVKKTVGAATTFYLRGADGAVLAEYDGKQALTARYVYAGNRRIARIAGSSHRYYLADRLGSTRALVDESGSVTATYDYRPYGKVLASSGTDATRFRFTGHERDAESNLDYMLARSYAYDVGRFLRPDPMQDEYPGISPYAYANNNPLKFVDPDGNLAFLPSLIGAAAGAAFDVAIQLAIEKRSLTEIDLVSVGTSAAAGAVGAGLVSSLSKLSTVSRVGVEVATDLGFSSLQEQRQLNEGGEASASNVVIDVLIGAIPGKSSSELVGQAVKDQGTLIKTLTEVTTSTAVSQTGSRGLEELWDQYLYSDKEEENENQP